MRSDPIRGAARACIACSSPRILSAAVASAASRRASASFRACSAASRGRHMSCTCITRTLHTRFAHTLCPMHHTRFARDGSAAEHSDRPELRPPGAWLRWRGASVPEHQISGRWLRVGAEAVRWLRPGRVPVQQQLRLSPPPPALPSAPATRGVRRFVSYRISSRPEATRGGASSAEPQASSPASDFDLGTPHGIVSYRIAQLYRILPAELSGLAPTTSAHRIVSYRIESDRAALPHLACRPIGPGADEAAKSNRRRVANGTAAAQDGSDLGSELAGASSRLACRPGATAESRRWG